MPQKLFRWMHAREHLLSALAMVGGFIFDTLFFQRIDLVQTQAAFAAYAAVCFVSILALHYLEARSAARGMPRPRWSILFPLATQFALGGFWSGFVIFYFRSAVFGASWPFLLLLLAVFIGNEYFSQYHSRLVFTSILFFFAVYGSMIFLLPVYTGTIGTLTFLGSGAIAIGVFAAFTVLLRIFARERFLADVRRIRAGALLVLLIVNVSYFTNILPPLPLSAQAAGIYHAVWRVPGAYMAQEEQKPWYVRFLGFAPTLHAAPGGSLSAYSSVFAPTALATDIVHRWRWYDPSRKAWVTRSTIAYAIVGGRGGGYRGYTEIPIGAPGKWRVDVETSDGRLIARLPFTVVFAEPPPLSAVVLR